jgi:hypothetical protein
MSSFLAQMRQSSLARLLQARAAEPEHVLWQIWRRCCRPAMCSWPRVVSILRLPCQPSWRRAITWRWWGPR